MLQYAVCLLADDRARAEKVLLPDSAFEASTKTVSTTAGKETATGRDHKMIVFTVFFNDFWSWGGLR